MPFTHHHENVPNPFNLDARPGISEAVGRAYQAYCESDESPKGKGPCPIRAAKYAAIWDHLTPLFPTYRELDQLANEADRRAFEAEQRNI